MHNNFQNPAPTDFPAATRHRGSSFERRGVALVIVLSFVALITGVVVAFFSLSTLQHQVSSSSASQTTVELFARGALNATISDLQQEIVDGSSTPSATPAIYLPTAALNATPQSAGTSGATGTENLVKRSAHGVPFYTNGVTRAANASTATSSANGRSITTARWNKPLLLAKSSSTSTTALTPVAAFTAPDWILVNNARVGDDGASAGNPSTWNANMIWSSAASNKTAVIGRYAYTIYNEGGLLDANVAGYPAQSATAVSANYSYKNAEAFADLTQLGLTQAQVNALVGWRNNASLSLSGTLPTSYNNYPSATVQLNYFQLVSGNTNGFLMPANTTAGTSSGTTDHRFATRQSLIDFMVNGVGQGGAGVSSLQNVLQYLGTYTRAVNAPTYTPSASRPKVIATGTHPNDDDFNPGTINGVRVVKAFQRDSDGTMAQVGEPLIKYRFSLSRLALFGNSNSATSDATPDIYKFFGLKRSSPTAPWSYDHGSTGKIMTLAQVAAATPPREPDFYELLQAGMTFGSLGQTCNNRQVDDDAYDAYTYLQVLQTGANIMDQYDTDSFPTWITLTVPASAPNPAIVYNIYGLECLPYICQVFNLVWRKDATVPPSYWYQPTLWNPQNSASIISAGPSLFRFVTMLDPHSSPLAIHFMAQIPNIPGGMDLTSASTTFPNQNGIVFSPSAHNNFFVLPTFTTTGTGASATGKDVVGDPAGSLGIYVATAPALDPPSPYVWQDALDYMRPSIELSNYLQYSLDNGATWITYDQIKNRDDYFGQNAFQNLGYLNPNFHGYEVYRPDPRCDRFGVFATYHGGAAAANYPNPTTPRMGNADTGSTCLTVDTGYSGGSGWVTTNGCYPGAISDNLSTSSIHYADPDGIIRPAMGAYTGGGSGSLASGGYPEADDSGSGQFNIKNSRPVVLNRPFRSVADMGYASRGAPWKNVDFFHTSSGDAALLDLFCVDPTPDSLQNSGYSGSDLNMKQTAVPLRAGALDLNTRQKLVIQAMLNGAIKQENFYTTASATTPTTASDQISSDAGPLASSLVALTSVNPLVNRSDLVTKWSPQLSYAAVKDNNIKSDRESAIRALADVGNTRTWNLLIDVIAQTGRYPANARSLDQFNVEGERRYWLHVAIDRYTGKVVSQNLEAVYE